MAYEDKDALLMLKVQKDDDKKAFTELYLKYSKRLNTYFSYELRQISQDDALAEEYTQEVFMKLWNNRTSYKGESKFLTYLFSIAENCWIDCRRKALRQPQTISFEDGFDENPL